MNSTVRITTAIGQTNRWKAGVATLMPSTAPSTEMAGVMTPSPYSSAAPNRPSPIRSARARPALARGRTRARSARMPPSPRLSARSTKLTYLKETTKLIDQNTSDITPITFSRVAGMLWWPPKHSLSA